MHSEWPRTHSHLSSAKTEMITAACSPDGLHLQPLPPPAWEDLAPLHTGLADQQKRPCVWRPPNAGVVMAISNQGKPEEAVITISFPLAARGPDPTWVGLQVFDGSDQHFRHSLAGDIHLL